MKAQEECALGDLGRELGQNNKAHPERKEMAGRKERHEGETEQTSSEKEGDKNEHYGHFKLFRFFNQLMPKYYVKPHSNTFSIRSKHRSK